MFKSTVLWVTISATLMTSSCGGGPFIEPIRPVENRPPERINDHSPFSDPSPVDTTLDPSANPSPSLDSSSRNPTPAPSDGSSLFTDPSSENPIPSDQTLADLASPSPSPALSFSRKPQNQNEQYIYNAVVSAVNSELADANNQVSHDTLERISQQVAEDSRQELLKLGIVVPVGITVALASAAVADSAN